MRYIAPRNRQGGAVIITVALLILFLLGFMGIAVDFGRLFIVKSELQTAMDSCALAAAQELDGTATAITRGQSAGKTAGNLNRVNLQSADWNGKGQLIDADITFRDKDYANTTGAAAARYVECRHVQPAVQLWLLQALGAFDNSADYPNTMDVGAVAVATRGSAQSTCPIPLALKPKAGGVKPNYGFVKGEWITLIMKAGGGTNGQIGWANLDGSNNAKQTEAELLGSCGTKVGDELGTPGVQSTVADTWNLRFGIYKKLPDADAMRRQPPDQTGYAFGAKNWPSKSNAYDGTAGGGLATPNFVANRASFASCASPKFVGNTKDCENTTGVSLNSFKDVAPGGPSTTGGHRQYGTNRRIVTVPVVNGAMSVIDYACMLMLQPMSIPLQDIQLEFIGNASEVSSPCTTSGAPGGSSGPLVPVLVR